MKKTLLTILLLALSQAAFAQLEPWKDYDVSDAVWSITTVKVDPNMGDYYLEGLRDSWVAANKVQKDLGHIEDFSIFRTMAPNGGDANMFLVVKFANTGDLAPNQEKYNAFMKAWGEANQERTREISSNYPSMRTITGEYLAREIELK